MNLSFLKNNWKMLTLAAVLLTTFTYAGKRLFGAFRTDGPPPWLQQTEHRSPTIKRASRDSFLALLRKAESQAKPITSIRFLELGSDTAESCLWTTEQISNGSFQPFTQVGTRWDTPLSELIGYYLLDGTPLTYITRLNPQYPGSFPVTFRLPQPLAPGATQLVIRRQKYRVELMAASNREFQFSLPVRSYLVRPGKLAICGVYLGDQAVLTTYKPQRDVLVADVPHSLVGWLEPATPPTINFSRQ